jgi:Flp pilus assembly pilin Flp
VPALRERLADFWADESGISTVEYVLILAFVASAVIVAADELATAVGDQLAATGNCIENKTPDC